MDRRGRVKVADFGLAKIVGDVGQTFLSAGSGDFPVASSDAGNTGLVSPVHRQAGKPALRDLTDAGKVMGTPQYMSPEQRDNPGEVDHRADIYALGVVFYQMLTGELPGKKIEAPSRKVSIDVRLDEVVLRALERKPELRYQQASALKTQVETIASTPDPRSRGRESAPSESRSEPDDLRRLMSSATGGKLTGFQIFLRSLAVAAFVWLVIYALTATSTSLLPRAYVATARVKLINQDGNLLQNEFARLESPEFLKQVVVRVELKKRLDAQWKGLISGSETEQMEQMIVRLRNAMELRPIRSTSLVEIRYHSEFPGEAAEIANAIAQVYSKQSNAEIVEHAIVPLRPIRPNPFLNLAIGVFGGGLIGLIAGGSTALYLRSRTSRSSAQTTSQNPTTIPMPSVVSRKLRIVAALFFFIGVWSLLDMLFDNGVGNVTIMPGAFLLPLGFGLLNRREFCRRAAVWCIGAGFVFNLIMLGWLFGKAFGLFAGLDVVAKILGQPMNSTVGAMLTFLLFAGQVLLLPWMFLMLMRDDVRSAFTHAQNKPRPLVEWGILVLVLLVMFGQVRLPFENRLKTGVYFTNHRISETPTVSTETWSPTLVPTKTILLTRETNQLVGTTTDTRTVNVWSDSTVLPGESIQALARQLDGELVGGRSSLFTRVKDDKVSTSVSLSWWFKEKDGFGALEAEQATAQIRERFTQQPLTLKAQAPLELFCVTNSRGGTLAGFIQYEKHAPAVPDADGKLRVSVKIQHVMSLSSPMISYSAKVPAGYTLRATASEGEAFTHTPAGPSDFNSSWHLGFRPGRPVVYPYPGNLTWAVPHRTEPIAVGVLPEPKTSPVGNLQTKGSAPALTTSAATLPQRPLRNSNGISVLNPLMYPSPLSPVRLAISPVRIPGQPEFEAFDVVLGEPKLIFSITNSPDDVIHGFLELVGPATSAQKRYKLVQTNTPAVARVSEPSDLIEARVRLVELKHDLGPAHPDVQAALAVIKELERLGSEEPNIPADLRAAKVSLIKQRMDLGPYHPNIKTTLAVIAELERMGREEPAASPRLRAAKARLVEAEYSFGPTHPETKKARAIIELLEGKSTKETK